MTYRSRRAIFGLVGTIAILLASIASSAGAITRSSTLTPKRGGTLNILDVGLSWSTLDPAATGANAGNTFPMFSLMYQGLFTTTPAGIVEPQLATAYSYNATRTVLTIDLRKGVKFQDGTPFNSAAAMFNLQRETIPSSNSSCVAYFTTVTAILAPSPYKLVLDFSAPYGPMISELAGQGCFLMASPSAVTSYGSSYTSHPVGTGPYQFVSELLNSNISYTRWTGYWQKGMQYFNNISLTVSANDQSAIDALDIGEAQVVLGASAPDAQQAATNTNLRIEKGPFTSVIGIRLNLTKAPFSNPLARRAVAQAINSAAIAKSLYGGLVQPTQSYETPDNYYFDGTKVAGYPKSSTADAASDVHQLGSLSFTMNIPNVAANIQLAEALAAQLMAAGINVTLNPLDETTVISDFQSKNYTAGMSEGGTGNFPDPDTLYYRNFDSSSPNNQAGLNDPVVDNLVTQARGTVVPSNRKKLYERVQEQLTGTGGDFPLIPLWASRGIAIESKKLHNFPISASGELNGLSSWVG